MSRFVGVKDESIRIVSNAFFTNEDLQTVELPIELIEIDAYNLMLNYCFKDDKIQLKRTNKLAKDLKIAMVSNYAMECDISSYAEKLFPEIIKHIKDFKLFIENNDNPLFSLDNINGMYCPDKIIQCWERGKSLIKLVNEIKKYNPDIILINHEWGIWSNSRHWISMMGQLSEYRIIVIMHSIFHHQDKTIVEATIPEIVVHLEGAKKVLKEEKKITGKVYVIKHGTTPCTDTSKLWNFYKSEFTFIQQGFLFRYKGFQNSIKAVHLLRDKYPNIFFTGLCSEGLFSKLEHDAYYKELSLMIKEYGIEENVGLIRGYQSDTALNAFLRTNRVAVFPYISDKEYECFGVSGAAPYAMTHGIPIITSNIHHFDGLPSLRADTPEEIAKQLDKLFSNQKAVEDQVKKQNIYLEENSWEKTALKYINVFEGKDP